MSIASEITRLQTAKANLKTSIEAKGVTVSSSATLDAYPALVDSIPSGGGGSVVIPKTVNFYDYDGTLVASYSGSEIQALTELPTAPNHSTDKVPLTFDEWNWTLAEIKANNTSTPDMIIDVGATYHTTDGKTHCIFKIDDSICSDVIFYAYDSGTVDWGDGITESFTGVSPYSVEHTYTQTGIYDCKITTASTKLLFGNSNSKDSNLNSLTNVFLASSVTSFGSGFFSNCLFLETVSIPAALNFWTTSNAYCFNDCWSIKCIIIPRGTTSLPNSNSSYQFFYGNHAKVVSFSGNITHIEGPGQYVYNVTIPSGVTQINNTNFFNKSYNMEKVVIPNTVTSIEANAFLDCSSVKEIIISSSITTLSTAFLSGCYMIRKVIVPSSVTTIGATIFNNCSRLERVEFSPTGLTQLGNAVFQNCEIIETIQLPSTVTTIGQQCFYNCKKLLNFTVPGLVTVLNKSTFYGCYSLANIILQTGLETIGQTCFCNCSALTEITIPSTVTSIGAQAFYGCTQLATITSLATAPPYVSHSNAFPSNLTKIYVPYSSDHSILEAYKTASNWSNFASIMEELPA